MPLVTKKIMDDVEASALLPFTAKANRLLTYFVETQPTGEWFRANGDDACGHIEAANNAEAEFVAHRLVDRGDLEVSSSPPYSFRLKMRGYERYEELISRRVDSAQAFVAMWFDTSMDETFDGGLRAGIEDAGYEAMHIGRHHTQNRVDDEIIAQIRKSRFLVADYTCGVIGGHHAVRGGVYFETGFAYGLNIPVIWTVREDCLPALHFDTRQFPHIVWKDVGELRTMLRTRIEALIGMGPLNIRTST